MTSDKKDAVRQRLEDCTREINDVAQRYRDLSIGAVVCRVMPCEPGSTDATLRSATLLSGLYGAIEASMREALGHLHEQMRQHADDAPHPPARKGGVATYDN